MASRAKRVSIRIEAIDNASEALRKVAASMEAVTKAARDAEGTAPQAADGMQSLEDASRESSNAVEELTEDLRALDNALDSLESTPKVAAGLDDVANAARDAGSAAPHAADGMQSLAGAAQDAGNAAPKAAAGVEAVGNASRKNSSAVEKFVSDVGDMGKIMATIETARFTYDFLKLGAASTGVGESFTSLASSVGHDADALLASLQAASKGYISDMALMQGANKAMLTGGEQLAGELPRLLEIAGLAARATGGDMTQLYSDLIEGISKAEPEILDNLGITLNLTQVYGDYAKSLGTTADKLTQAEKSTALLNAVLAQGEGFAAKLDGGLQGVGGSAARLEAQFINLKNRIAELSALGLESVLSGGDFERGVITQQLMEGTNSWAEYQAAVDKANEAMTANARANEQATAGIPILGAAVSVYNGLMGTAGDQTHGLSQAQYTLVQSLTAQGVAFDEAIAKAQALTVHEQGLTFIFDEQAAALGMNAEARTALVDRTLAVSAADEAAAATLKEMVIAVDEGRLSVEVYESTLALLEERHVTLTTTTDETTGAVWFLSDAMTEAELAAYNNADATLYLADATVEKYLADIEAQTQAIVLADQQRILEDALYGVISGTLSSADASAILVGQLGLEIDQVGFLIAAYIQLQKARMPGMALDIGAAIGGAGSKAALAQVREIERINRATAPRRSGGGGRAGGGSTGRSRSGSGSTRTTTGPSPEERERERIAKSLQDIDKRIAEAREAFHERVRRETEDYARSVAEIEERYRRESLAAEQAFNRDKFRGRADFYTNAASMDAGAMAEMVAREQAAWDEAQRIAQAGNAQAADAYLAAAREVIAADVERNRTIAALQAELADSAAALSEQERADLAARLALLQEADRLYDEQDAQRLERLKNAENELANERDQALSEERQAYEEAITGYKEQFDQAMEQAAQKYNELIAKGGEWSEALVAAGDAVAQAMANAIAAAGAAATSLAHVEAAAAAAAAASPAAPESRYLGGPIQAGRPYLVGDGPGGRITPYTEMIVPRQSGTVIPAPLTRDILLGQNTSATNTTSSTTINMPTSTGGSQSITPSGPDARQLEALVNRIIEKHQRQSRRRGLI